MTRFLFPDPGAQLIYTPPASIGRPLASAQGMTVPVYLDSALTLPAIDLLNSVGSPLGTNLLTVDATSQLPDFFGPDNVDQLYVPGTTGFYQMRPKPATPVNRAAASGDTWQQSLVTGDAFPRARLLADGGAVVADGTVDPASRTGARWDIQGRPNELTLRVRAANDVSVHSVIEIPDKNGALIAWLLNAGGMRINDEFGLTKGVNPGVPDGVRGDIYGFLRQNGIAEFRHAGPPGNRATFAQATAEVFNGSRAASNPSWITAFGATTIAAVANPFGAGAPGNPSETFNVFRGTQVSGTTLVMSTGTATAGFAIPVIPGNFIKMLAFIRAGSTGRVFTPTIQWYNSSNTYLSSGDSVGSTVSDVTGSWTVIPIGIVVPATAGGGTPAFAELKLSAVSLGASEVHYTSAFGAWVDTRTASSADPNPNNVWSPPLVVQPGDGVYTGMAAGDRYGRSDTPSVANQRLYVLNGTFGTTYAPSAVGAPGSTVAPCWVGIA